MRGLEQVTPGSIIVLLIGVILLTLFIRWMYKQK
jgi:hypothetical protein